jgi:hypothetical protein
MQTDYDFAKAKRKKIPKIALTRTAISALRSIHKQPDRVVSYIGQKDVCYAAAQLYFRAGSITVR